MGIKWPISTSAEFKNEWSCAPGLHVCLHGLDRDIFTPIWVVVGNYRDVLNRYVGMSLLRSDGW